MMVIRYDKLKTVPADLSKLSNVVKNDVIKKTAFSELVKKVEVVDDTKCAKKQIKMLRSLIFKVKYLVLLV